VDAASLLFQLIYLFTIKTQCVKRLYLRSHQIILAAVFAVLADVFVVEDLLALEVEEGCATDDLLGGTRLASAGARLHDAMLATIGRLLFLVSHDQESVAGKGNTYFTTPALRLTVKIHDVHRLCGRPWTHLLASKVEQFLLRKSRRAPGSSPGSSNWKSRSRSDRRRGSRCGRSRDRRRKRRSGRRRGRSRELGNGSSGQERSHWASDHDVKSDTGPSSSNLSKNLGTRSVNLYGIHPNLLQPVLELWIGDVVVRQP
jgi:hypothetical protein